MRTQFTIFVTTLLVSYSSLMYAKTTPELSTPKIEPETEHTFEVIKKEHILSLKEAKISYDSLTGTLTLKGDDKKNKAHIFFTAYFLKDKKPQERPITFCFNGGPGSSSIWLHMGALGPKKTVIQDLGKNAPPGRYETNLYSLLDHSDLVFVDPVSTGFSTPAEGVDPKQFYGVEEDISCIAEFIQQFVSEYQRWGSPKFLLGESYGTLRVVGLADKLYEEYFMNINGLVLISSCLNLQAGEFDPSNDLGYVLALPSLTATAWYHKRLTPELQSKTLHELLAEVEEFALHEYATALLIGADVTDAQKRQLAEKIATYTALSTDYVLRSALKVRASRYMKELLRQDNKVIGRYDGRYIGFDRDQVADTPSYDPSLDAIASNVTSSFLQYLSDDLGWKKNQAYRPLNFSVHPWNWGLKGQPAGMGYLSLADHLKSIMIINPNLRVFIASGYYDLATPYFATDYTVDHLQLAAPLMDNVEQHYYDAGHMMYTDPASLIQLKKDLSMFIDTSL